MITSCTSFYQAAFPVCHRGNFPQAVAEPDCWNDFFVNRRAQQSGESLLAGWMGLVQGSPQEIGRNQSLQAGPREIEVDGRGSVNVNQAGHFEGLLALGCGQLAFLGQATPAQNLKFEDGNIALPNGTKIPFGNRGAIVVMADGSQVAVGRNSESSSEQVRTAYAGPGEKIPTSPPGMTNVFYLDKAGQIVRQEVL